MLVAINILQGDKAEIVGGDGILLTVKLKTGGTTKPKNVGQPEGKKLLPWWVEILAGCEVAAAFPTKEYKVAPVTNATPGVQSREMHPPPIIGQASW